MTIAPSHPRQPTIKLGRGNLRFNNTNEPKKFGGQPKKSLTNSATLGLSTTYGFIFASDLPPDEMSAILPLGLRGGVKRIGMEIGCSENTCEEFVTLLRLAALSKNAVLGISRGDGLADRGGFHDPTLSAPPLSTS
jgi:hypothetical protein